MIASYNNSSLLENKLIWESLSIISDDIIGNDMYTAERTLDHSNHYILYRFTFWL